MSSQAAFSVGYGAASCACSPQMPWSSERFEPGQQPVHHVLAGQASRTPGEARRDLTRHVIEQSLVRVMIYAGTSGCRNFVWFHKLA